MVVLFDSEHFPLTEAAADNSTRRFRKRKIRDGPISAEWDMGDHLVALKSRMSPLRVIRVELLSSAIRGYRALWPEVRPPASADEMSKYLLGSEDRLGDLRSSAARVGADEALMYVLSWYEGINLDALKTLRDGSKWTSDPDFIRRRQEMKYSLIQYAPIHSFVDGPWVPPAEEVVDVDEEIDADTAPGTASGADSATATEDVVKTRVPPTDPSTTDPAA